MEMKKPHNDILVNTYLGWLWKRRWTITNVSEDVEKLISSRISARNVKRYNHFKYALAVPTKISYHKTQ